VRKHSEDLRVAFWLEIQAGLIHGTLTFKVFPNTYFEFTPDPINFGTFVHSIPGTTSGLRLRLCSLAEWLTYIHLGKAELPESLDPDLPHTEPDVPLPDPEAHETDDWAPPQAADLLLSDDAILRTIESGMKMIPNCIQLAVGLSPFSPWAHFTLRTKIVEKAIKLAMMVELAGKHYDSRRPGFPTIDWAGTQSVQDLAERLVEEALGSIAVMLATSMVPLSALRNAPPPAAGQ
jgi:hypothetical protein